nr:hypothetical protein CFP56_36383 [Quercus suber]
MSPSPFSGQSIDCMCGDHGLQQVTLVPDPSTSKGSIITPSRTTHTRRSAFSAPPTRLAPKPSMVKRRDDSLSHFVWAMMFNKREWEVLGVDWLAPLMWRSYRWMRVVLCSFEIAGRPFLYVAFDTSYICLPITLDLILGFIWQSFNGIASCSPTLSRHSSMSPARDVS